MQPDEVGLGKGDNQRKPKVEFAMAESIGKGSKKEEGCTPMVMGSHPMAKERAETGGARGIMVHPRWRGIGREGAETVAEVVLKDMFIHVYVLHIYQGGSDIYGQANGCHLGIFDFQFI